MKTFTDDDIRSWKPCYDPERHLVRGWQGTALDILKNESIPFEDRFWVVLRTELMSERTMRLFAVWTYRQTLAFVPNSDSRSIAAANAAEKYANGEISKEELADAESAAVDAAHHATHYAARCADAESARSAAYAASESAGSAATKSAAASVWSASYVAWCTAESAKAAFAAARAAQRDKLIEMIEADEKESI